MSSIGTGVDTGQFMMHHHNKVTVAAVNGGGGDGGGVMGKGHFENWGESAIADNSQQTDTSTDIDTDDKNQVFIFVSLYKFFMSNFFLSCFLIFQMIIYGDEYVCFCIVQQWSTWRSNCGRFYGRISGENRRPEGLLCDLFCC